MPLSTLVTVSIPISLLQDAEGLLSENQPYTCDMYKVAPVTFSHVQPVCIRTRHLVEHDPSAILCTTLALPVRVSCPSVLHRLLNLIRSDAQR